MLKSHGQITKFTSNVVKIIICFIRVFKMYLPFIVQELCFTLRTARAFILNDSNSTKGVSWSCYIIPSFLKSRSQFKSIKVGDLVGLHVNKVRILIMKF